MKQDRVAIRAREVVRAAERVYESLHAKHVPWEHYALALSWEVNINLRGAVENLRAARRAKKPKKGSR